MTHYYKDEYVKEKISEKLSHLFEPVNRIDKMLVIPVNAFMKHYVVPYFTDVITRHSQQEFHQKISDGFDLVEDMRINHPDLFQRFLRVTRKFRNRLVFNESIMLDVIVEIVESFPYFWKITPDERAKLFDMIHKLKMEIYT
jgi:hypothetical protein